MAARVIANTLCITLSLDADQFWQYSPTQNCCSEGLLDRVSNDGDHLNVDSDTMVVIKPVKGKIMLPSYAFGWAVDH